MATFYLLNATTVNRTRYRPGDLIDDARDPKSDIENAGGVLWASSDTKVAAAAALVQKFQKNRAMNDKDSESIMFASAANSSGKQSGSGTLVAGVLAVTGVTVTATSKIFVTRKTAGGTVTSTIMYDAPSAGRTVGAAGTGSFSAQASVAAGTPNAADTSVVDWLIVE